MSERFNPKPILSPEEVFSKEKGADKPFDALILLCGGVHRKQARHDFRIHFNLGKYNSRVKLRLGLRHNTGEWKGNFETQLKVKAAKQAVLEQRELDSTPVVISSGGAMWGAPPLGEIMTKALTEIPKPTARTGESLCSIKEKTIFQSPITPSTQISIPEDRIAEENKATDTGVQMKNILEIVREHGFKKVGVIADSVHLKVAVPLLKNWAEHQEILVEVEGVAMEDLLIRANPRYKRVIDKLHNSLYWRLWKLKYGNLAKTLVKDPLLNSLKARISGKVIELMRTKSPFYHLRLPGTR